ncbi:MAG: electron transport complex subunit RsxG [Gammaproteobacteria bacterium]|nr:electron transport complex subunit RsxG [Gammaproteobacteria bacterium]
MKPLMRNMIISALLLGVFAVLGTAMVSYTFDATRDTIAENERQYLLENLHVIIAPEEHDNDLYHDTIEVTDPELLGTNKPVTVYRARKNGQPVGVVMTPVAPNGYGGAIRLMVGIYRNGRIAGVRVLGHKETPGLGDGIEADRSDWIMNFAGKSLSNPGPEGWAVKKDGGKFDQFTGATITPRAVVKAVNKALVYFERNKQTLFVREESANG